MSKKVLFFSAYGHWLLHNQVDAVLAKALELRGQRCGVMLCDGYDGPCASTRAKPDCESCLGAAQSLFRDKFGLPTVTMGALLTPDDHALVAAWMEDLTPERYVDAVFQDRPIGAWTLSSVFTHFRISSVGLADPDVRAVHRGFLRHAAMTYLAVCRQLERERPDQVVLFNARFYQYRIALEAARERDIPVIVHERGRLDNAYAFYENESCLSRKPMERLLERWQDLPLFPERLAAVDGLFETRRAAKGGLNYHSFYKSVEPLPDFHQTLGIPRGSRLIGVFTSSQDEVDTTSGMTGVDTQTRLVDAVFRHYENEPNTYVIVRHHPHIGGGSNIPQRDVLPHFFEHGLTAPANARIIMPQDGISSYALFPYLDRVVAAFSSIGLETLAYGIPTLTCAQAFFSGPFRLQFERPTPDDLAAALPALTAAEEVTEDELRVLYRYVSIAYFEVSWRLKSIGMRDYFKPVMDIKGAADLLPGADPALDQLCDHVIAGAPLFPAPSGAAADASPAAESAYLRERMRQVAEEKRLTRGRDATHVVLVPSSRHPEVPWLERLWRRPEAVTRLAAARFADLARAVEAEPAGHVFAAFGATHYSHTVLTRALPALAPPEVAAVGFNGWLNTDDRFAGYIKLADLLKRTDTPMSQPGIPDEELSLMVLGHFVFKREALLGLLAEPLPPHLLLRRIQALKPVLLDEHLCLVPLER